MVISLITSKKAQNVIKTSVDLSRQDDGNEMFGSSAIARSLVRSMTTLGNNISKIIPEKVKVWLDSRFNKDEAILANGAAFDLVRASVIGRFVDRIRYFLKIAFVNDLCRFYGGYG